ncbi:MAG: hypothetical protein AAF213_13260, partial [Pseudomonadota bacterium]
TAEVQERLDHLERRLDGKRRSDDNDKGNTYQFPNRRGRNGRGGPANDDGMPIAAKKAGDEPRLIKAARTPGL